MTDGGLFIDVACRQVDCRGERICGDSFLSRRVAGGRRTIVVLSDGMGHGVKANILATLTSTMLAGFITQHEDITRIAESILKTLPVCSVRKISYSTFTMLDVDNRTGEVTSIEYDNPRMIVLRGEEILPVESEQITIRTGEGREQKLLRSRFTAREGDRIVVVSDGVTQSGQRSGNYRFGWGEEGLRQLVRYLVAYNHSITSRDLATQVISKACQNDLSRPSDDMSCVALHLRGARRLLVASCPPAFREEYGGLAERVRAFEGTKVICGYPVAEVLASQMRLPIERGESVGDCSLPPLWRIPTFELVTEGIATLNRTLDILERGDQTMDGGDPARRFCRELLRHDEITFIIGTKRNVDSDSRQPDEFELRRNLLRRLAELLRSRYTKQVFVNYV